MTTGLTDKQLLDARERAFFASAERGESLDESRAAGLRAVADLAITSQEAESAGLQREIQGLEIRVAELEKATRVAVGQPKLPTCNSQIHGRNPDSAP